MVHISMGRTFAYKTAVEVDIGRLNYTPNHSLRVQITEMPPKKTLAISLLT
uniref:Uncharacterized protein n=1 Tax=Rhizophora mucronata TaxID=61149 RepID=A0A2P2PKH9_RHIMU